MTITRRQFAITTAALGAPGLLHAQDAAGKPMVIGQSAHLSGPLAPSFQGVLEGQKLAIDQFNARGGVGGRPVQLVTLDDAFDPARCVANVNRLIDEHDVALLTGLASTPSVAAVLPVLAERKVPLVGVYAGSPTLRQPQHPYFFTSLASYFDEAEHMLTHLQTLQLPRVSLVLMQGPFGQLMQALMTGLAKQLGIQIVATHTLNADGSNGAEAAKAALTGDPQSVLLMAFGPCNVPFMKALRTDSALPVYVPSIASSEALLHAMGPAARGVIVANVIPSPRRTVAALGRDFKAAATAAGQDTTYDRYFGYINLRVALEVLRRAGPGAAASRIPPVIEAMGRVDLGGYAVQYGPQRHHGSRYVDLAIVGPDGRYVM
jgi:branched-chain amino acid transport system substrate-binding protein